MSEMLALPMVSDCIKRGNNIDDCGVSRTITSMSRLGCTHPPDNARFWGHLQPKDQARCSFQKSDRTITRSCCHRDSGVCEMARSPG